MSDPAGDAWGPGAMEAMLDVARRLGRSFDLCDVLRQVIEASQAALRADRGSVFLLDRARNELYTKVGTGDPDIRLKLDKGIVGQCASTLRIINVPDCYADPRFEPAVDSATGYRTRSLMALPLIGLDDQVVGVMEVLNSIKGAFDAGDERFAEALAVHAAIAIQKAQWTEDRLAKARMERDLDLARRVQQRTLPATLPVIHGYEVAAMTRPADETGGDVYDLLTIPNGAATGKPGQVLVLLGDVSGHGIGPALTAMSLHAMVRLGIRLGTTLDELLAQVAEQVREDLSPGRFITAFLGTLDPVRHRLDYHSAGQGPLLVYRAATQQVEWRQASMLPLGIEGDAEGLNEGPQSITFAPGDILLLLSDGFFEYQNPDHRLWGHQPTIELVVKRHQSAASELLQALLDEVLAFAKGAPQTDDLTGIVLKRVSGT